MKKFISKSLKIWLLITVIGVNTLFAEQTKAYEPDFHDPENYIMPIGIGGGFQPQVNYDSANPDTMYRDMYFPISDVTIQVQCRDRDWYQADNDAKVNVFDIRNHQKELIKSGDFCEKSKRTQVYRWIIDHLDASTRYTSNLQVPNKNCTSNNEAEIVKVNDNSSWKEIPFSCRKIEVVNINLENLASGQHQIYVHYQNKWIGMSRRIYIDNTETLPAPDMLASSDDGIFPDDNITTNRKPVFSVSCKWDPGEILLLADYWLNKIWSWYCAGSLQTYWQKISINWKGTNEMPGIPCDSNNLGKIWYSGDMFTDQSIYVCAWDPVDSNNTIQIPVSTPMTLWVYDVQYQKFGGKLSNPLQVSINLGNGNHVHETPVLA